MKRVPDIAMDFMGRGGKRLRPRICEAAWRSLSGEDASRVAPLALCEGQGDELSGHAGYVSICERKTGSLFALAAALGALAAGADPEPYWRWGIDFGVLFQAMDDIRDDGETPLLAAVRDEYRAKLPSHALLAEFGDDLCR